MFAAQFHRRVDTFAPTISVIRARNGYIFGGYTSQHWSGSGYKSDTTAWIFSLVNAKNMPFNLRCTNPRHAISSAPNAGPTFGGGYNIWLANDFASNGNYTQPHDAYRGHSDPSILAGSYNFTVDDIEVFTPDTRK